MSQHDQDTQPKRKRRGTSVMVWVLMIMLIAGLGGFGVTNFGGSITSIGTVGGRNIDVNDYARALKSEMDAFSAQIGQPITLQEATALGLDARVRQQLQGADLFPGLRAMQITLTGSADYVAQGLDALEPKKRAQAVLVSQQEVCDGN